MKAQENISTIKIVSTKNDDKELIKKLKDERINIITKITLRCAEKHINGRNTAAGGSLWLSRSGMMPNKYDR